MIHYLLLKSFRLFPHPFMAIVIAVIHRFKYDDRLLQFSRFRFTTGISRDALDKKTGGGQTMPHEDSFPDHENTSLDQFSWPAYSPITLSLSSKGVRRCERGVLIG